MSRRMMLVAVVLLAALGSGSGCCCCLHRLAQASACCKGCGEVYWHEWFSDPPDCCDPCDCCGNYRARHNHLHRTPPALAGEAPIDAPAAVQAPVQSPEVIEPPAAAEPLRQ